MIVNWCRQTDVAVRLQLQRDASVTGKIGDAVLPKGRLRRNRGWLGRKLNIKTDYIVHGRLTGTPFGGWTGAGGG